MAACQTRLSRQLDEALRDGMTAGDPPAVTEPAGDARDAHGCCCGTAGDAGAEPAQKSTKPPPSCCSG